MTSVAIDESSATADLVLMSTVGIAVGVRSMKKRLEISAPGRSSGLVSVLV